MRHALAGLALLVSVSAQAKTYVIPHVLEKSGTTTNTAFTFDTTLYITYTAGLISTIPAGPGATVDLYLFDSYGYPMRNAGAVVCNPCSFTLNPAQQTPAKLSVRFEDLILARGAFDTTVKTGFGLVVVNGDSDSVNLSGFIVNSHTSAFDLVTTPLDIQGVAAAP